LTQLTSHTDQIFDIQKNNVQRVLIAAGKFSDQIETNLLAEKKDDKKLLNVRKKNKIEQPAKKRGHVMLKEPVFFNAQCCWHNDLANKNS
jgi:hypothetical protein